MLGRCDLGVDLDGWVGGWEDFLGTWVGIGSVCLDT
jgi:hypothetical protein